MRDLKIHETTSRDAGDTDENTRVRHSNDQSNNLRNSQGQYGSDRASGRAGYRDHIRNRERWGGGVGLRSGIRLKKGFGMSEAGVLI